MPTKVLSKDTSKATLPCPSFSEAQGLSVCFTPDSDCTGQIAQEIAKAKKTIRVQAFSFTSSRLAKAFLDAQERGVKVEMILDKENAEEQYTPAPDFYKKGIQVYLDGEHQTAHNKVILVDGETVVTGSFNFTKAAQNKNAENVLILRDPSLTGLYQKNWEEHKAHSQPYFPSRKAPAQEGQGQRSRK